MIVEKIIVGNMEENCYLAGDESAFIVIDPGDEAEVILSHIREHDYKVAYVVLTHCHFDHVGAVAQVMAATGARLALYAGERDNYHNRKVSFCGYFSPKPTLPEPDVLLQDGEEFVVGNCSYHVIHTPGHTSGSMCLLSEDHLFSGDTLFYETFGRTDFPTGSTSELCKSVKEKLFTLDDAIIIHPGHGPDSTVGYERQHNEIRNLFSMVN